MGLSWSMVIQGVLFGYLLALQYGQVVAAICSLYAPLSSEIILQIYTNIEDDVDVFK